MKLRRAVIVVLAVTMLVSMVAAKILGAITLWYEWIALAVFGACALALNLLSSGKFPSSRGGQAMDPDEHLFGGPMDVDEAKIVAALEPGQVAAIDAAILQDVPDGWSKVAMVLGKQLKVRAGIPNDIPLEYYWQRLSLLVDQGRVEVQGDLRRARYSEVRSR
jgi:hypothetical protein